MSSHEAHGPYRHESHDHAAPEPADHVCIHGPKREPRAASEHEELLDEARAGSGLSRRAMLAGFGAVAASAGLAAPAAAATGRASGPVPATDDADGRRDRRRPYGKAELVLLGTRAGPPPVPTQAGISSALVVNGAVYVVDCGRASTTQYLQAGLRYDAIRAFFVTHLHADHVNDLYNYFLLAGHIPNALGDHIPGPRPVYGPGRADGLPPKFGGGVAPTIAPEDPTPGLVTMIDHLHRAYAYSSNVFLRDMTIADIRTLIDAHEIVLPKVGASYRNTAPTMKPFEIYRDENVLVSAILVPHVMFPSFAFRFDTEYGSVTFSGDTAKTPNIPTLAQDTTYLVHEGIGIEGSTAPAAVIDHMLQTHVLVGELGPIAQAAGAENLVVSHTADIAKTLDPKAWQRAAQKGYTRGRAYLGEDLQRFVLHR